MSTAYTTVMGDMWDAIAYAKMGSTEHTGRLMSANPEHHAIFIFPAGVTLAVPDVPVPPPGGMPPWKRVGA
jgi:phage tail protein X